MKAIREFAGQPLMWVQPRAMKQRFELRCGDEVLAAMQWQSSWRSGATTETAEGSSQNLEPKGDGLTSVTGRD